MWSSAWSVRTRSSTAGCRWTVQPSILTESGDLVFLGPYLQYFSNAQALTIKWILENRAGNPGIEPGDMFVSNDPYVGTPHQPDTIVAAPVFVGDELFCWVANVMHHADVGGSVMGSFCVDATDMFTDPPAFPPFKLVSRGEVRRDLEGMFLRQSRVPTEVHMDLRAAISANRVAVERITALVDRYGADAVKAVMNRVLDAGERTVAQRLAKITDGRWSHRLYAEAARTGDSVLSLYRRALKAGADGAGRFRGGRGFVEAGIPWTVPGLAAAVYVDESFPKAVGPFGANPGSAGHFRLRHGTDVVARLAAGEVPQDFDAIGGAEAEVEAKGPMLMMGADAAWEWTGANAPGFGDPLARDPGLVEADVATGALPADAAERVYGVVPGDSETQKLRTERLASRLADAVPPAGPPATVPDGVPLRILAGELALVERDGRPEAFVTVTGRAVLAPASGNFKDGCAVLERPLRTVAPEFATREGRAGYLVRYREYLCPVTGLRVDSEIIADGDEALHDIVIGRVSA